ncbi:MAG: DUF4198 domain-containing protein [Bacteroidota bacterium]
MNIKIRIKKLRNTSYKIMLPAVAILLLCSHDLYLKMETYFLQPNQEATISLYNGTFEKSENLITRDRMLDASIVSHGERKAITPSQWTDQDSTITQLPFTTGKAGTYVVGVSTKARNIELKAKKFNDYLAHDGVLDMLEYRKKNNLLDQDAVESYQKHVKAIYQVGDEKTNDWNTVLGYPIEFVPQANPYETYSGEQLKVQLLLDGKPLANQLVYANHIHTYHEHDHGDHGHGHDHKHDGKEHSHGNDHKHDGKEHSHENDHKHDGKEHSHGHDHKHNEKGHSHDHDHKHDGKEHSHDDDHQHKTHSEETHTHTSGQQLRTDAQGMVTVAIPADGIYYLRTIHMETVTDSDELTHRSKWATLTFEVTHKHNETTHKHNETTHTHDDHEDEDVVPTWVFIALSILIIGLLFIVFRKKD